MQELFANHHSSPTHREHHIAVNQTAPKNCPTAVATSIGWAHDRTGEQLVSVRGLAPDDGTESYKPNSPVRMRAYSGIPDVAKQRPKNLVPPVISSEDPSLYGLIQLDGNGTWESDSEVTIGLQWAKNGSPIAGATGDSYTVQLEDATTAITCIVTATNEVGSTVAVSNSIVATLYRPGEEP